MFTQDSPTIKTRLFKVFHLSNVRQQVDRKRDIRLDLLRFVAIVLVLGRHTYQYLEQYIKKSIQERSFIESFFIQWQEIGWIGVDLFFIISGFLISDIILRDIKRKNFNLKRFLIRREFKIYPPFLILIATTVLYHYVRHIPISYNNILSELYFIQNYTDGIWNHTWSLAVEEHFYLMLPITLMLVAKTNVLHKLPIYLTGVMLLFISIRIINYNMAREINNDLFFEATHLRADSFVPGVIVAYFKNFEQARFENLLNRKKAIYILVFLLTISFCLTTIHIPQILYTITFTFLSIGFCALLMLFLSIDKEKFNKNIFSSVAQIGRSSYQIYLWHMCVMYWAIGAIRKIIDFKFSNLLLIIIYIMLSIGLGLLMNRILERPLIKIRNKLFSEK